MYSVGGWRSTQKKRCSLPAIGWRSGKEKKRCSSDWDQSHLIEDNPIRPNDKDSRCNRFSSQIQPPPTLTSITRGGKQRKRRWEEFSLTFLHFWPLLTRGGARSWSNTMISEESLSPHFRKTWKWFRSPDSNPLPLFDLLFFSSSLFHGSDPEKKYHQRWR